MIDPLASMSRRFVAALLVLVLTLGGVGRGLAEASDLPAPPFGIAGVATPICHAGRDSGSAPDGGAPHDCCEACALLAAVVLPEAPFLHAPAPLASFTAHANPPARGPTTGRLRTPRQSQGPPIA